MESIRWVGIRTDSCEPMAAFLSDVMGIGVTKREPDHTVHGLPDGELIEVFGPTDPYHQRFPAAPVPGFRVKDVKATAEAIAAAGGELLGKTVVLDGGIGWQHFRAPDGNQYEVVSGPFPPGPPARGGVPVKGLSWVGAGAEDFEAMSSFLEKVMGVTPAFEMPGMRAYRFTVGSVFEVFGPGHRDYDLYSAQARGPVLGFHTDHLQEAWDRLVEAGAERIGEIASSGGWGWAHMRLPDGNLYEILAPWPESEG
jgi:predicted enzyme related to lactoylglutathione lyase